MRREKGKQRKICTKGVVYSDEGEAGRKMCNTEEGNKW